MSISNYKKNKFLNKSNDIEKRVDNQLKKKKKKPNKSQRPQLKGNKDK
jgi:hypothetical protein